MARLSLSNWYVIASILDGMEASGANDAQVAEALGVVPQTIANWKKGLGQPSVGDIREFITRFGGADEEEILYAQQVVRAKKAAAKGLEFDSRFNAILLAKGERHYNRIFNWEPERVHGPLQTDAFHTKVLKPLEGTTDEVADFGRDFKVRRAKTLRNRTDPFTAQFFLGEAALGWLRELEANDRRDQLDYMREWNSLSNFEIRIMAGPHTFHSNFHLFQPVNSPTAGPAFVFTQIRDRTWCIEEPERVKLYHEPIEPNWRRGIPLEEYLDAQRDRLA